MISFFSRWGLLSRRYLWPHLIFGIVAAGLGLPATSAGVNNSNELRVAKNHAINSDIRIYPFIRLRELVARTASVHDYWHQHAIRVVIRHLSFTLPAQEHHLKDTFSSLTVKGVAALHSLFALLTTAVVLGICCQGVQQLRRILRGIFSTAYWLATVRGIRAGPLTA